MTGSRHALGGEEPSTSSCANHPRGRSRTAQQRCKCGTVDEIRGRQFGREVRCDQIARRGDAHALHHRRTAREGIEPAVE